jgi:hypothetical protein
MRLHHVPFRLFAVLLASVAAAHDVAGSQQDGTHAIPRVRHAGGMKRDFARPDSIAQLLLNINSVMSFGDLLQPGLYHSENLELAFNATGLRWGPGQIDERTHAWVRQGSMQVQAERLPRMTVSLIERSAPSNDAGAAEPDWEAITLAFASVSFHVDSKPALCVCDLRDELGPEKVVPFDASDAAHASDATSARVVYDYSDDRAARFFTPGERGQVTFLVRRRVPSTLPDHAPVRLQGRDEIEEFTITAQE